MTDVQEASLATPRLRRGLAVVPVPDGLLIDGGVRRHLFTGGAATSILPALMPLLDGGRDVSALAAALGLPGPHVEQALRLLQKRGLLESSPGSQPPASLSSETARYLSRTFGQAGPLAQTLARAAVVISAPDRVGSAVAADLAEAGVGEIVSCGWGTGPASSGRGGPSPSRRLAVVADAAGAPLALADHLAAFSPGGSPALRCSLGPGWAEVGPLFYGTYSACPRCFARGYQSARWEPDEGPAAGAAVPPGPGRPAAQASEDLLAGLVVAEVLALLAGTSRPASQRALTRLDTSGHVTRNYLVTPYPDCLRCGWQETGAERPGGDPGAEQEMIDYEWQLEARQKVPGFGADAPAAGIWSYRSAERPPSQRHLDGQKYDAPRYRAYLAHRALPAPEQPDGSARLQPERLISGVLARLHRDGELGTPAGGAREPAEPGGSGITAVEFYIVAEHGILGLPATVHRYDEESHSIFAVHAGDISLSRFLRGCDLRAAEGDLVLVGVGPKWALIRRIGDLAYRTAHLEAGRAALRLARITASYGTDVSFARSWPRDMSELLELRPDREMILTVAGLSMGAG
jgi:bacteriocin biosynthesis cyclodehydratase domain-containing protein